jgi:hypothetical protein
MEKTSLLNEIAKRDLLLTAAAVIFTAFLVWWCWPFALVAVTAWIIWMRRRSAAAALVAAVVAILAAAILVVDVAVMGYAAAWVAKALSYNTLFKKAAVFRAIIPEYYLTHPMAVLRSWVVITESPIDAMNLAVIRPLFRADHILAIGGLFLDGVRRLRNTTLKRSFLLLTATNSRAGKGLERVADFEFPGLSSHFFSAQLERSVSH